MKKYVSGYLCAVNGRDYWHSGLLLFDVRSGMVDYPATHEYFNELIGITYSYPNVEDDRTLCYKTTYASNEYQLFDVRNRRYLTPLTLAKSTRPFTCGWVVKRVNEKGRPSRFGSHTVLTNLRTKQTIKFAGAVEILTQPKPGSVVLLQISKAGDNNDQYHVALFDLDAQKTIWSTNFGSDWASPLNAEFFCVRNDGIKYVYAVQSGDLSQTAAISSKYSDRGRDGAVYHDSTTQTVQYIDLLHKHCHTLDIAQYVDVALPYTVSISGNDSGDELFVYSVATGRLSVCQLNTDQSFRSYYIPASLFDNDVNGQPLFRRVDGRIAVFVQNSKPYENAIYSNVLVFDETDLKPFGKEPSFDELQIEPLSATYQRLPDGDNALYYRLFFSEVCDFSTIYRNLVSLGRCLCEEHGSTNSFIHDATDRRWSGRLQYDLSNQQLSKEEMNEVSLLCQFQMHSIRGTFYAGIDIKKDIEIEADFADT